jgi:CheY-like chemotaxis protein
VLIVDDNQDAANSLALLLDFQGHATEVAYSSREALDGIALTGYGQAEDRQRAQAAGFDEHLIKPVDLAVLQRALTGASVAGGSGDARG